MSKMTLSVPAEFSFEHAFAFLQRSAKEPMHRVGRNNVTKLLRIGKELVLFSVSKKGKNLIVDFHNGPSSTEVRKIVKKYVNDWFDLKTDLKPFYILARKDEILRGITKRFH